jgi:hypothetical protein
VRRGVLAQEELPPSREAAEGLATYAGRPRGRGSRADTLICAADLENDDTSKADHIGGDAPSLKFDADHPT